MRHMGGIWMEGRLLKVRIAGITLARRCLSSPAKAWADWMQAVTLRMSRVGREV